MSAGPVCERALPRQFSRSGKINPANIALTINVQRHEELEERLTEIERHIEMEKQAGRG